MPIRSLLIANRGEIAVRIIRAARELGIQDRPGALDAPTPIRSPSGSPTKTIEIGPAPGGEVLSRASTRSSPRRGQPASTPSIPATASSPRTPAFADAVEAAGLIFVGPRGDTIRLMGDKVAGRAAAIRAGVPTIPGSSGRIDDFEAARAVVDTTGFPVMIKAAAGGGGRGIRIARDAAEFAQMMPVASAEAQAAFGDGGVYVEKLVERARHVEVQVLGDGRDVIHLFERECSLQRRRQKVWEEAPSPALSAATRERHSATPRWRWRRRSTIAAPARSSSSMTTSAGDFYFIEMNTRIQVEHPVTELVTGVDLVREMLRIAGGEPLRFRQEDIALRGHAIEVRINAEDPSNGFMPFPGKVGDLQRSRRPRRPLRHHALSPATRSRPSTIRCSAS